MKICNSCGNENEDNAKFCVECGEKLQESQKYCHECGTELVNHPKFCPECGTKVNINSNFDVKKLSVSPIATLAPTFQNMNITKTKLRTLFIVYSSS